MSDILKSGVVALIQMVEMAAKCGTISKEQLHQITAVLRNEITESEKPAKLVNRRQKAEQLGVCTKTVDRMANEGKRQRYRIGNAVRFDLNDLEGLLGR